MIAADPSRLLIWVKRRMVLSQQPDSAGL